MRAIRSKFIVAIGVLHTAVALFFGGPVLAAIVRDGVVGAVEPDLRRMYWFWFLMTGAALLVLGHLAHWIEARLGRPLPKRLGWSLLVLGAVASAAMPVSGGWLVGGAGIAVLWQPGAGEAHDHRAGR